MKNKLPKMIGCGLILFFVKSNVALSDTNDFIDCPLRDTPFSISSPLMDIMLSKAASDVANAHMDGVINKLPATFASAQAPSFSAILNLKTVAAMGGLNDPERLDKVNAELSSLPLTESDKQARCARYDMIDPGLKIPVGSPRVLLFEKMTGFRDGPSVEAAASAFGHLAEQKGWALVTTDKGGVMVPEILNQFDVVIWNNVSGDVLTLNQRQAFEDYIHQGGGYVGIHGSAGDPIYFWDWYVDTLIGARFIGHPMDPQFQNATINFEPNITQIGSELGSSWIMKDEWYSFRNSPRQNGAIIIATIDESTYSQNGRWGQNVSMGVDHPIVWSRCVGYGRSFYSAIGHRPEVYSDEGHLKLLTQAVTWASDKNACFGHPD